MIRQMLWTQEAPQSGFFRYFRVFRSRAAVARRLRLRGAPGLCDRVVQHLPSAPLRELLRVHAPLLRQGGSSRKLHHEFDRVAENPPTRSGSVNRHSSSHTAALGNARGWVPVFVSTSMAHSTGDCPAQAHTSYFRSNTQAAPCPPSRGCANSTINTSLRRVRCSHTLSRSTPAPPGAWVPLP